MKSILLAIDESKSSKAAINVASELSKISGAKIKGLYVENSLRLLEWQPVELIGAAMGVSSGIPHARPTPEQVEVEKEFIEEGNRLKKLFDDACLKAGVFGTFYVKRGTVEEIIVQESRTVDFVIIGRRGKTFPEGLHEAGPTTENLLRHTTRPVLVVPEEGKLKNKILIAYDRSETSQRALIAGVAFASLRNTEIAIISVANDINTAEECLSEAKEFLSSYNLKSTFRIGIGAAMPWKAIMEEVERFDPGVIILGAFGSNRILELIFGSTTKQILMEATCPVLLCR